MVVGLVSGSREETPETENMDDQQTHDVMLSADDLELIERVAMVAKADNLSE